MSTATTTCWREWDQHAKDWAIIFRRHDGHREQALLIDIEAEAAKQHPIAWPVMDGEARGEAIHRVIQERLQRVHTSAAA